MYVLHIIIGSAFSRIDNRDNVGELLPSLDR